MASIAINEAYIFVLTRSEKTPSETDSIDVYRKSDFTYHTTINLTFLKKTKIDNLLYLSEDFFIVYANQSLYQISFDIKKCI